LLRDRLRQGREQRLLLVLQRLLSRHSVPDHTNKEEGMRLIARLRPSPALVVASLALLVALGGTGMAAVALVPKNSVGSKQVIDGSLQSEDLAPGQVLAGAEVLARSVDGPVTPKFADTPVATLEIRRPGAYVLWATAQVDSAASGGQCTLLAHGIPNGAGGVPDSVRALSEVDSGASPTLWMTPYTGSRLVAGVSTCCA